MPSPNTCYEFVSWALLVKLFICGCHRTPLLISQHHRSQYWHRSMSPNGVTKPHRINIYWYHYWSKTYVVFRDNKRVLEYPFTYPHLDSCCSFLFVCMRISCLGHIIVCRAIYLIWVWEKFLPEQRKELYMNKDINKCILRLFRCRIVTCCVLCKGTRAKQLFGTQHIRPPTGPRWIPCPKASDAELSCFLWSASE